jgi:signal transduction histidine kinase
MKGVARRVIHISSMVQGDEVILRVQDTGEGIPPGLISSIFDPFFTTKPVGYGTGLGLAISYGIIKDHQGMIDVQSSTAGTTFLITLALMKGTNHRREGHLAMSPKFGGPPEGSY